MPVAERAFGVMGVTAHLVVVADRGRAAGLADKAAQRCHELERRWSRFLADSEISQLNRRSAEGDDVPLPVSADTIRLLSRSQRAWLATGGRFDPTVLPAVVAAGLGLGELVADETKGLARLPAGAAFDPGGIGKGLAADLVAEEAMACGAAGVLVNIGGDLRVIGQAPTRGPAWCIGVEHPTAAGTDSALIHLIDGGVATSSPRRAAHAAADGIDHLIDPRSGRPLPRCPRTVTVVAGTAWWAEAMATAALVEGLPGALSWVADGNGCALLVEPDGRLSCGPGMEVFLR